MNEAIRVEGLVKRFGPLTAVDNVSFSVKVGEIFGILGPNGAGKTTTLEIIEGLQQPTQGHTLVLDIDTHQNAAAVKERIGVQLQASAYFDYLTLTEILDLFGQFYSRRISSQKLLERVGLSDKANAIPKKLSGGQRQRFTVAASLVNDPEVVILDEPTTGLDPQARRNLWELIRQFHADGRTVVLTTHYIEEAEALCDRVAIMDSGRIIALDTPANLVRSLNNPYTIKLVSSQPLPSDEIEKLAWKLQPIPSCDGHAYELRVKESPQALSWLLEWAATHQVNLEHLVVITATLEDVFLELTGKELRD